MIQKLNLKKHLKNEKYVLCFLFVALGTITYFISHPSDAQEPAVSAAVPEIDELIPPGHVLVPIDLVNREALSSMMGQTAVVDLLTVNPNTMSPQHKIASRVKIIRTPKNPDVFALLLEEQDSTEILSKPGPYFALIQNRKYKRSDIFKRKTKNTVRIHYQE